MYNTLLVRVAESLSDVPGIRRVLVGLEETGDTPCIRLWINSIQQPDQTPYRRHLREIVTVAVQVDSFPGRDRRAGYLRSLEAVAQVKARLEQLRLLSRAPERPALPLASPEYQLLKLPDSDAIVHLLICPFESSVDCVTGETDFLLPPLEGAKNERV